MKEKSKTSCFSTILYIVSALVTAVYFYLGFKGYSPFLRAGVMVCACVFLYLGTRLRARNCGAQTARMQMKKAFAVMFFLYAFMLVSFLFFEGYFGRDSVSFEGFSEYFRESTNLVPFKSTSSLIYGYCMGWISLSLPLVNIGGNLVAFMPFAFFLPILFEKMHKPLRFVLAVSGTVIFVEITQLVFRRGVCDIDDLILNVLGAWIVYMILRIKSVRRQICKLTFGLY